MPSLDRHRRALSPVPILLYHSVSAGPPDWIADFTVTPSTFRAHLDVVVASGREPITVSQLADGLCGGGQLPARPVLITVDDGFADFADNAMPALAERKLPSTLYVTTGALAGRRQRKRASASRHAARRRPPRPRSSRGGDRCPFPYSPPDGPAVRKPGSRRGCTQPGPARRDPGASHPQLRLPPWLLAGEGIAARRCGWLRLSLHRRRGTVHRAGSRSGPPAAHDPSRHRRVCGRRVARWFPRPRPAASAQSAGLRLAPVSP